ncbi:MAG: ATP-binding protein [Bacteroidales bacterium]|nr:ATP-binding protein [Bacteroidales bacterium]
MDNTSIDKNCIELLSRELGVISDALNCGIYNKRLNIEIENPAFLDFQRNLNQILELFELNLDIALIGDDSLLNEFIDVFSSFAVRNFDKTLQISNNGTIIDAIAAGVNMLGQELEGSTVSKNELEIETNRLNESQEIAKIADWEFYLQKKILVFSKTFTEILEIESSDFNFIYKEYKNKLIGENSRSINKIISNVQKCQHNRFENIIKSNDNTVKYLSHIITHIYNSDNELEGYKGIIQDITLLKESQNRLKYKTQLDKLIANISSSFIKKSEDFELTISNSLEIIAKFFNVDRAYFLKFASDDLNTLEVSEYNSERVAYNTRQLFRENPALFELCVFTARSENAIQISDVSMIDESMIEEKKEVTKYDVKSFMCIPVYNDKLEFGIFGMDCVDKCREWSDAEMNALKIIANIISDAIYRNIFEKELIIARKKAEESDRLKSAFLANMSHEIRTPMNAILGFAELLKIPNLAGEQQLEFVDIIDKSGNRMLNTIDDIIKMSRIDSEQEKVYLDEVELVEMIKDTFDLFKLKAQQSGLDFEFFIPEDVEKVCLTTDKEKVNAILSNLVNNAIKFTKNGSVKFGFNLENGGVTFFVKDTGVGIDTDKFEAVFERFVQEDVSLNRVHEGSGLGLAISKAYIELIGGSIWFESQKGFGSSFYFKLNSSWKIVDCITDNGDELNVATNLGITVLIAEDQEVSQLYLSCLLKNYCDNMIFAPNGKEALKICTENSDIDLVLMDIKMPIMDGHAAALEIKKKKPNLPIIAQTAFSLEDEKKKFGDAFDGYLTKPIGRKELLEVVFDLMKK